ncbi:hypothetical protein [Candidatus Enterococcus willemsii]|nr:hypothetical protein [Enterococcus sp. CU12B]
MVNTNSFAMEQHYESNGQTSFYGNYEYPQGSEKDLNSSSNYSSTGQKVLPRTGDFVSPIYSNIGIICLITSMYLIFIGKRSVNDEKRNIFVI